MDIIIYLFDFIIHLNLHLSEIVTNLGAWSYSLLFIIIFAETGFVIMPFLPGDSLLFAVGAISAIDNIHLNVNILSIILFISAFLGNTCNYWIGRFFGKKIFKKDSKIFKQIYLEKTKVFYKNHGAKTVVISRFLPFFRTFVPFVGGMAKMDFKIFSIYNFIGALLWAGGLTYLGYFFGNIPIVKNNFGIVILILILISVFPIVIELIKYIKNRMNVTKL